MLRAVAGGAVTSGGTGVAGVSSFNLRTGAVTLFSSDISNAGGALLLSPVFTGDPRAPTPAPGDADTSIATTAFVAAAIGAIPAGGVTSFNTRTGAVSLTSADISGAGGALLASPVFTGDPQVPTATPGDNDNSIASTAFVQAAITAATSTITAGVVVSDTPPASPAQGALWWNSAEGQLYLSYHDVNSNQWVEANSGGLNDAPNDGTLYARQSQAWAAAVAPSALAAYAPLANPVFTGDPQAPTATIGDNDTSVATTAFVQTAVAGAWNNTGRNLLHNSLFNIQQRGAGPWTFTATATPTGYTADRWFASASGSATAPSQTISIFTLADADRTAIGDEAAIYALRNVFTSGTDANAYLQIQHRIEIVGRISGKTVTVSLWARANTAGLKLGLSAGYFYGSTENLAAPAMLTLTTGWARYSATFNIPTAVGQTGLLYGKLNISYMTGTNYSSNYGAVGQQSGTIDIWGAQLEIGSMATPLAKRDPADDLALCQRFYQTGQFNYVGYGATNSYCGQTMLLPVTMRTSPVLTPTISTSTNSTALTVAMASGSATFINISMQVAAGPANAFAAGSFTASADL